MPLSRQSSAIAASFLALVSFVSSAKAEGAMSCQDFRVALGRAIDEGGNKVAHPNLDKRAGGFGPTSRYEMTEIVGLDGQLICWKDLIFNFSATGHTSSGPAEAAAHVLQFKALAAAATCAISLPQPTPQECMSKIDALVRLANDAYAKARVRGEAPSYGEAGARFDGGARMEVEAGEDSLAFFLYSF